MKPLLDPQLATVTLRMPVSAQVLVKGIVEAHEGEALFFAEKGGDVVLACPRERAAGLRELARDLAREFGGVVLESDGG